MLPAADRLVDRYLQHITVERRLSAHTCEAYRRDLHDLREYCARLGLNNWNEIDVHIARGFAAQLRRRGLSSRSIQRTLSAARSLYRYLIRERSAKLNPFAGTSAPKSDKRLPKTLNVDQMTLLLAVKERDPLAVRDRAIMELLYSSGVRLAELVGLDLDQLDATQGSARVTGKGQRMRDVPIGRLALDALNEWLPQRALMARSGDLAVFVSKRGRRISERTVQHRIAFWARKQGVGEAVHPHMLRHSFATHILESSGELRAVQELLGHANISTTQIYTHLDFQHLAKVYDASHPRAKKPIDH